MKSTKTLTERFWSKVQKTDTCWLWKDHPRKDGYGRMKMPAPDPHSVGAHRLSWTLHYGPIPQGLCVLHHCDVPLCVRPEHLFLGTPADNNADMASKGRVRPGLHLHPERAARGERHGFTLHPERAARGERNIKAKLTAEDVRRIRARFDAGAATSMELSREYNVTDGCIWFVVHRRTWKHVVD